MAQTEHYNFWYLDPDEEISDFPNTWDYNVDKFDAAIYDAATNAVTVGRVPNLPASKTTSGEFAQARIPNLPASKTTSGTFADARIPSNIARIADIPKIEVSTSVGTKIGINGQVIYYDSGWRDISGDIQNEWGGKIQVRRTLDTLNIAVIDLEPPETAPNNQFCPLPSGFQPYIPASTWVTVPVRRTTNTIAFATISKSRLYFNREDEFQDGFWNMLTVPASEPLPTSLPGDPA